MLTYSFENRGNVSLYEYLYKQIKQDIITYKLSPDEKLPSKRAFAQHLNISTITVENAYSQLLAEGYIYSRPKSGYYVSRITPEGRKSDFSERQAMPEDSKNDKNYFADFVSNSTQQENFPFSSWTKLMRETMSDNPQKLMVSSPSQGIYELRKEIARYLYQFRGMDVSPDRIVVGAGTEYLYSLIIQLLGRNKVYAVEDPGYSKITRVYAMNNVRCVHVPVDKSGVDTRVLEKSGAQVLHISPTHHFPTGIVTPVSRRYEILSWAAKSEGRYIIEDDYDSEFRFLGKPIPSLESIDVTEKTIYINTFSKSLASTIRISYMVLPKALMEKYNRQLSFYSCTVSNFEQYTLAAFLEKGYFEKHIGRMRNHYRTRRDRIMSAIKAHPRYNRVQITEENAGLHFLLQVNTDLTDEQLIEKAAKNKINISCLSQYYFQKEKATPHTIIINYSAIKDDDIERAVELLFDSF